MTISGDYPQPVQVNGFTCHNCSEVDLAKKHIDPAHPRSGPFDIDAASDPSRRASLGADAGAAASGRGQGQTGGQPQPYQPGQALDLKV